MENRLAALGFDLEGDDLEELLANLSKTQASYLDGLIRGDLLWYPEPGPQTAAYLCEADVLFYGGAAGGGKSDLILGLAINAHSKIGRAHV